MDDYEIKERIEKTEYLVEADSTHSLSLWTDWSTEARRSGYRGPHELPSFEWVQHAGAGLQVGTLDKRPIMVTLMWNVIGGALICFYHGSSQLVDHKMIEEFLMERFKGVPRTDSFSHVARHIQERDPDNVVVIEEARRPISREALEEYERDGVLTTRLLGDYGMEKVRREHEPTRHDADIDEVMPRLADVTTRLDEAVDEFARVVWAAWLKQYYRDATMRNHEANSGQVNMLVGGLAGRVMISLRRRDRPDAEADAGTHITLLGYDGEGDGTRLGVQGIRLNGEMAIDLVREATRLSDAIEVDIRPNAEVGMG